MKKDDIHVEITDEALIIQGERQREFADTQGGYQRSERSYGSFYRAIPLPEEIDPEQMRASFQDGVLKVTVPLPPHRQQQRRRRRILIHRRIRNKPEKTPERIPSKYSLRAFWKGALCPLPECERHNFN